MAPMLNMDAWNWVLLAVGVYVATTTLVALMRRRRQQILDELVAAAEEERRHQQRLEDLRSAKRKRAAKAA
jgi:hypothetical protein